MNIYASDHCPVTAARNLDDKTLEKMCFEIPKILSTALFNLNGWRVNLYKPTFVHHPCVRWAGRSRRNFDWLVKHGMACCNEYTFRFGPPHVGVFVVENCFEIFKTIPIAEMAMTPFANTTEFGFPVTDAYRKELNKIWNSMKNPKWTRREAPRWYKGHKGPLLAQRTQAS